MCNVQPILKEKNTHSAAFCFFYHEITMMPLNAPSTQEEKFKIHSSYALEWYTSYKWNIPW